MSSIEQYLNKIFCEKMGTWFLLKSLPSNSIDSIITDPPYGYSFMGKDWDKAVPPVEVWKECYRVLKDGAFIFVMSAPRQDVLSQMIVRLTEAGFNTGFTSIYWTYASGFPKAMNVGKMVDKRLGVEREVVGKKECGYQVSISKTRKEQGYRPNETCATKEVDITVPTSEQAKILDGSYGGFQPKPAVEIIIVCMKPLSEKTYVEQALKNRKGVTWLDDARIPYLNKNDIGDIDRFEGNQQRMTGKDGHNCYEPIEKNVTISQVNVAGRFPANLLVSDDILNDGIVSKSVRSARGGATNDGITNDYGKYDNLKGYECGYPDSGSFSRYFDLDKWFEKTVEDLPETVRKTFPLMICPKASKGERNQGCQGLPEKEISYMSNANGTGETWHPIDDKTGKERDRFKVVSKNFHPTVKPLKLMSYLVVLGSREGDVIVDPFVGSGSTCIAAKLLNRKWIGIDCFLEYCEIASARLGGVEIVKCEQERQPEVIQDSSYDDYVKAFGESSVREQLKQTVTPKGNCGYSGRCDYRNEVGNCTFKRYCKEKIK